MFPLSNVCLWAYSPSLITPSALNDTEVGFIVAGVDVTGVVVSAVFSRNATSCGLGPIPTGKRIKSPAAAGQPLIPPAAWYVHTCAPVLLLKAYILPSSVEVNTTSLTAVAPPTFSELNLAFQRGLPVLTSIAVNSPVPAPMSNEDPTNPIGSKSPNILTIGTYNIPSARAIGVSTPPRTPGSTRVVPAGSSLISSF